MAGERRLTFTRVVRIAVGIAGGLLFLIGLVAIGAGEPGAGAWAILTGAVLVLAALLEAARYRPAGEGGERRPSFERTGEVFLDPTTGQRMRVWSDPRTGERRYEADSSDD